MKISKIDRLVSVVIIGICLVKAVLYGGSKPSYSGTGVSPVHADTVALPLERARCPFHLSTPSSSQVEDESSAIHHSSFTLLTSWNKRGAYSDWQRIDFPDGFAFPCGTNLLSSVTLISYGTLRQTLTDITPIAALPAEVSLEPVVSSVIRGLTPSNSYLFAWQNVCVERDATNRVDAAIELFASGDVQVRFGYSVTNIAARPPKGFVGVGQDNAWALAAFPDDYDAITNKGYEAWLMEDKVGINEQNGLYKVSITVSSLPPDDVPCYLICGPYKVIVTAPGTYSFPLEVLTEYTARTFPIDIPLEISYDDGYRGCEASVYGEAPSPSPRLLAGRPIRFHEYDIHLTPSVYITPAYVPFPEAEGKHLSIWCNVANASWRAYSSVMEGIDLVFHGRSDLEIRNIQLACMVIIKCEQDGHEISGALQIGEIPWYSDPTNDVTHVEGTNSNSSATGGDSSD